MANDPIAVARMARALKERAGLIALALSDESALALADEALTEGARVITIVPDALPLEPFLVLTKPALGSALRVLATGATVVDVVTKGTAYLQHEGIGSVYLAQVQRVLTVAP